MTAPATVSASRAPAVQPWDPIVTALRAELEEYGGLLQLFEEQQRLIFTRDSEGVSALAPQLEQQAVTVRQRRAQREKLVREFGVAHGRPAESSLRQLLPLFPIDLRPLLDALIDEVNHLVTRSRQRARQNRLLLARLVEMHQSLLPALRPNAYTKTYSRRGQLAVSGAGTSPTLHVTG